MNMSTLLRRVATLMCLCLCCMLIDAPCASACVPETAFRDYLQPDFWGPYKKKEMLVLPTMPRSHEWDGRAFAGMDNATLPDAGGAYRQGEYNDALELLVPILEQPVGSPGREEAALLQAKCRLRKLGRGTMEERPDDVTALIEVGKLFQTFIETAGDEFYKREARGWLARIDYLKGHKDEAIQYYLAELADPRSIYSEKSLRSSFAACDSSSWRMRWGLQKDWVLEHLDLYMQRPEYALWAIHSFTTGRLKDQEQADTVRRAFLEAAGRHGNLFSQGDQSAELVLALMRAALYTGDLESAIAYSDKLPEPTPPRLVPELMWMCACCAFLRMDFDKAEQDLIAMRDAPAADRSIRMRAWMGLMGVYYKRHQPVELLHAIIRHAEIEAMETPLEHPMVGTIAYGYAPYYLTEEWNTEHRHVMGSWDLEYFLDARLTIDQLKMYLERYGDATMPPLRQRISFALAVHLAREERYAEAIEVLESLKQEIKSESGIDPEVSNELGNYYVRYKEANKLYDDAFHGIKLSSMDRLQAQYAYGRFLSRNPDRLFFNRTLWFGMQKYVLYTPYQYTPCPGPDCAEALRDRMGRTIFGLPPFYMAEEIKAITDQNRQLQDIQEERWRAAILLMDVAQKAGDTKLAHNAVSLATATLRKISHRFGRSFELDEKIYRLIHWPWQIPEDSK